MIERREQANSDLICLEEEAGYCGWNASQIRDHFKSGSALVEREGDLLRGCLLFRAVENEYEILSLTVDYPHRRRGVGKTLIKGLAHLAKQSCKDGKGVIFLEVSEENEIAKHLYLTSGFKILYRREKYYENGAAALIMEYRV